MAKPLVLYSANTKLAFQINEKYYNQKHYVWCSDSFNRLYSPVGPYPNPPSSTPLIIYERFAAAVRGTDLHSSEIEKNAIGLRNGAVHQYASGLITEDQRDEILAVIEIAQSRTRELFLPLIYVIPYANVEAIATPVPIIDRAAPLSDEFIIKELDRQLFDTIEF